MLGSFSKASFLWASNEVYIQSHVNSSCDLKPNYTLTYCLFIVRAMDCGIDGAYMEEGVAEIYILDTDELFSSYIKRLCIKVRNADSVTITMRGTEGSTTHVEVNRNN